MESKDVIKKYPIQFRRVRFMIRVLLVIVVAGIVLLQWPYLKKLLLVPAFIS